MDKFTGECPQTTTFLKRKESRSGIEPRSFRLPAKRLTALGQTDSLPHRPPYGLLIRDGEPRTSTVDFHAAPALNMTIKQFVEARPVHIVQELCESRGGRPGLSVLTSLLVSVDIKIY